MPIWKKIWLLCSYIVNIWIILTYYWKLKCIMETKIEISKNQNFQITFRQNRWFWYFYQSAIYLNHVHPRYINGNVSIFVYFSYVQMYIQETKRFSCWYYTLLSNYRILWLCMFSVYRFCKVFNDSCVIIILHIFTFKNS